MKKNTIAIIGLGYWGTIVTNTVVSMNKFKKIYVYDNNNQRVINIKKKFGSKIIYTNFNKIKNDNQIKNIFLATPPKDNYKILTTLVKKNKNILVEKPGLINLSYYKKIKKEIKKSKSRLSFGYIYVYNEYIKYIKKIIDTNKLGKVKYINLQRQNFGPIRNKVSAAFDLATHDISILYYILKRKIMLP